MFYILGAVPPLEVSRVIPTRFVHKKTLIVGFFFPEVKRLKIQNSVVFLLLHTHSRAVTSVGGSGPHAQACNIPNPSQMLQ